MAFLLSTRGGVSRLHRSTSATGPRAGVCTGRDRWAVKEGVKGSVKGSASSNRLKDREVLRVLRV